MPVWAWIAIALGVLLLVGAAAALGVFAWRAYEQRLLLKLVVRTEAVEAASAALIDAVSRLASASDEELEHFADDVDSVERRVLHEVANRGSILAVELDHMALPARLVPVAEALSDAAFVIGEEAGRVHDDSRGPRSLEELGGMDLGRVRGYTSKARFTLTGTCDACGLDETAVYGGGLYL